MTELRKSQEIEDVLASIRRLVTDDDTAEAVSEEIAREAVVDEALAQGAEMRLESAGKAPDKLVLTPQLRVLEPEDPYQTIQPVLDEASETLEASEATPIESVVQAVLNGEEAATPTIEPERSAEPDLEETDQSERTLPTGLPEQTEAEPVTAFRSRGYEATPDAAAQGPVFHHSAVSDREVEPAGDEATPKVEPANVAVPENLQLEELLDKEHLRELIAEVVREELSGHLGERITRNVRKLVRREIRQSIAAEKFE